MRASVRAVGLVPPHLAPDCSGCTPSEWAPRPPSPSQFHWHTRPAPPAGGDAGDAPAQPRKHNCVVFVRAPAGKRSGLLTDVLWEPCGWVTPRASLHTPQCLSVPPAGLPARLLALGSRKRERPSIGRHRMHASVACGGHQCRWVAGIHPGMSYEVESSDIGIVCASFTLRKLELLKVRGLTVSRGAIRDSRRCSC